MMILAYLLQSSRLWWGAEVTVKMMIPNEQAAKKAEESLKTIIAKLRTGAQGKVIVSKGRSFYETLRESSSEADLIFLGMATPDDKFAEYYENIQKNLQGLPTTVMVLAGREISFGEVLMQQEAFDKK